MLEHLRARFTHRPDLQPPDSAGVTQAMRRLYLRGQTAQTGLARGQTSIEHGVWKKTLNRLLDRWGSSQKP
jgi:hypothetical protein